MQLGARGQRVPRALPCKPVGLRRAGPKLSGLGSLRCFWICTGLPSCDAKLAEPYRAAAAGGCSWRASSRAAFTSSRRPVGVTGGAERLGLGGLDHEGFVHGQRKIVGRRVEAVVDEALAYVERPDGRALDLAFADELVQARPVTSPVSKRSTCVRASLAGVAATIMLRVPIRRSAAGLSCRLPRPSTKPCAPMGLSTSLQLRMAPEKSENVPFRSDRDRQARRREWHRCRAAFCEPPSPPPRLAGCCPGQG